MNCEQKLAALETKFAALEMKYEMLERHYRNLEGAHKMLAESFVKVKELADVAVCGEKNCVCPPVDCPVC